MGRYKFGAMFLVLFCILLITEVNLYFMKKDEYKKEFSFLIKKIHITQTGMYQFYDANGEEVYLLNNPVFQDEDIRAGDSLFKGTNSAKLYIFRRSKAGTYYRYLTFNGDSGKKNKRKIIHNTRSE